MFEYCHASVSLDTGNVDALFVFRIVECIIEVFFLKKHFLVLQHILLIPMVLKL